LNEEDEAGLVSSSRTSHRVTGVLLEVRPLKTGRAEVSRCRGSAVRSSLQLLSVAGCAFHGVAVAGDGHLFARVLERMV
jgi:hypothetical protein